MSETFLAVLHSRIGIGLVAGLLICAGIDFTMLGVSNTYSLKGVLADVAASAVMGAIVGGIIGWYFGMGKKAVA